MLQAYIMMSTVYLTKVDGALEKHFSSVNKICYDVNPVMLYIEMYLDVRIVIRFSDDDTVTQEVKYHCSCPKTHYTYTHSLFQSFLFILMS